MNDQEKESLRLKRLVAERSLEKQVLRDVAQGNSVTIASGLRTIGAGVEGRVAPGSSGPGEGRAGCHWREGGRRD